MTTAFNAPALAPLMASKEVGLVQQSVENAPCEGSEGPAALQRQ
jgi:hypothetical protein